MSTALIITVIALALLIVSFILAVIQNGLGAPLLWAVWAIGVYIIIGGLAGAVRP